MNDDIQNEIIGNIDEIYENASEELIRSLIGKYFVPTNEEMALNAEISTPVLLVDEMLNLIPEEFWTKPKKVIEPCCGKGNFVLGIFDKFYNGLKNSIPDISERCEVIMKECIYFCDLTEINVFITTEILKRHIKMFSKVKNIDYLFNSWIGNTLTMDTKSIFGLNKFHAVIGNPPYSKFKSGIKKGGYGGKSLWDKFVVCALENLISKSGYLLFVHPPSWRKPEHYLWKILSSKQILYLRSMSEKNGKLLFGCATLTDYYLLKNVDTFMNTEFIGEDDIHYSVDLRLLNFLPSGCVYDILKLVGISDVVYSSSFYDTRRKHMTQNVLYSRTFYGTDQKEIFLESDTMSVYPIIHSMTKKNGIGIIYSKEDRGHFNIPKVILSLGRNQYPYNDWKGNYGMSQSCFGLEIDNKEDGDNIVKAINTDKFKKILKYTKWNTYQTEWRMFKYFKEDFWKEFV